MNSGIESSFYRWDTGNASGTRSEGRLLSSIQAVNTLRHHVAVAFTFLNPCGAFSVRQGCPMNMVKSTPSFQQSVCIQFE
jgi:hypothetical protein